MRHVPPIYRWAPITRGKSIGRVNNPRVFGSDDFRAYGSFTMSKIFPNRLAQTASMP